jgi:hypothetical protein
VAHLVSIRFQINRKQETLMEELQSRLSHAPEKIVLKTDADLRAATRDGTGAEGRSKFFDKSISAFFAILGAFTSSQ